MIRVVVAAVRGFDEVGDHITDICTSPRDTPSTRLEELARVLLEMRLLSGFRRRIRGGSHARQTDRVATVRQLVLRRTAQCSMHRRAVVRRAVARRALRFGGRRGRGRGGGRVAAAGFHGGADRHHTARARRRGPAGESVCTKFRPHQRQRTLISDASTWRLRNFLSAIRRDAHDGVPERGHEGASNGTWVVS